jgi:hypothetical protein
MRIRIELSVVALMSLMDATSMSRAHAQPVIGPGQAHTFTAVDSDGVACRVGTHVVECRVLPFLGTGSPTAGTRAIGVSIDIPDDRRLSAGYIFDTPILIPLPLPPMSVPHYSTASVYNDFFIPKSSDTVVEAQISVTYDCVSEIFAGGAFKAKTSVTMGIEDVSGLVPVGIASHELSKVERSNEQGFTDFSFGSEREVLVGETSSFVVKLRTGCTYRIRFSAEAMGEGVLAGEAIAFSHAGWQSLSVLIDGGSDATGMTAGEAGSLIETIEVLQRQLESINSRMERLENKLKTDGRN